MLRAFTPRELPAKAQKLVAKLAVPSKPATAAKLSLASKDAPVVVLHDGAKFIHRDAADSLWELWAHHGVVTARPRIGSTAKTLLATLARVTSWNGIELAVPENFAAGIATFANKQKIDVDEIAAVEPIKDGISLELS